MGRAYLPEEWVRNPKASMPVKALGAVLSSYASSESGDQDVWPSPETVAVALGISARHVQNLSAEGEALAWWTRIHERTRTGGVMLTWRLHFPEITTNRSPTEHERNSGSVGDNHYSFPNGSRTEAQQKPNGSRTEAERNHSSDGRVEGKKVRRKEGTNVPSGDVHVEAVIEAYNTLCPSHPRCRGKVGSPSYKVVEARWKREPDLELWRARFAKAEASDFLSGRKTEFRGFGIAWLLKPDILEKLDSGAYDNRNGSSKVYTPPPATSTGKLPPMTNWENEGYASEQEYNDAQPW
jgi:hypothetical protein